MRLAILSMLLVACGPVVIEVGNADGGVNDCSASVPCAADSFCNFSSCGAPLGQCALKTITCPQNVLPVCGCDGVTYLNLCQMQQAGVSLLQPEECGIHGAPCDQGQACPAGATCGRISPDRQCTAGRGRCWNVPATCPWAMGAFSSCNTGACVNLCQAMHGNDVFTPTMSDTCP
jgi:hypothetical protein